MLDAVLAHLLPKPGMRCVDMTVGLGGHAAAMLERIAPDGRLLGIDRDSAALEHARERLRVFGERCTLVQGNFSSVASLAHEHGFDNANTVLCDLGVSSLQLDDAARGFSWREDAPLDMRMGDDAECTAADIINTYDEDELTTVLREYGGERCAHGIAREICRRRREKRIATTRELASLVSAVYARRGWRHSKVHPATRAFQAFRMAVNGEAGALEAGLRGGADILAPGGRFAVISFHSGEDRAVKHFFRALEKEERLGRVATKKPLEPDDGECSANPRARSAKLRVFERAEEAA